MRAYKTLKGFNLSEYGNLRHTLALKQLRGERLGEEETRTLLALNKQLRSLLVTEKWHAKENAAMKRFIEKYGEGRRSKKN